MGAALSSRAEWTSASEKGGKLNFSKTNEALLLEILKYTERLCKDHPREASVTFKRPFVWQTSLRPKNFDGMKHGEDYSFTWVLVVFLIDAMACVIYNDGVHYLGQRTLPRLAKRLSTPVNKYCI